MKIIRIDVKKKSIFHDLITKDSKYFLLGARGLTSQIISDEVNPLSDPLGPKNKLVIANGILAGSPFANSARSSVGAKSPLTNGIKEANVGGRPAMMLARHGIRAIVFKNTSDNIHILLINDNKTELIEADEYKGLGNYELHSKLYKRYGDTVGIYSIGPAGEHMMKSATVAANDLEGYPSRHAARGGLGAVLGSKGIKAIVIIPTKESKAPMHDLKKFRETSTPFAKNLAKAKDTFSTFGTSMGMKAMSNFGGIPTKNFSMGSFNDIDKISGEALHELVLKRGGKKRLACSPTCVIKCSNLIVDEQGNHITSSLEYETMCLNGTNLMINDLDSLAYIDHFCDDTGIDTIEYGGTCGVAMDCGKIDWGDAQKVIQILDTEIRNNTEAGKLYGNGVKHIGDQLKAKRIPEIKGQGISAYDPRVMKAMGVTYATTPMGADHTSGAAIVGRIPRQGREYGEYTDIEHKLDLSFELQVYTTVMDTMGCCYFIGPSYENMSILAKVINAMYDLQLTKDDVINIGISVLKTEIEFNKKAGITQDDNDVPEFFKTETSQPKDLKFTFTKDDLKNFWNRLDNYVF